MPSLGCKKATFFRINFGGLHEECGFTKKALLYIPGAFSNRAMKDKEDIDTPSWKLPWDSFQFALEIHMSGSFGQRRSFVRG
jgi:hypothetical protein